jgi:hypothetical protein
LEVKLEKPLAEFKAILGKVKQGEEKDPLPQRTRFESKS